MSMPKEPRQLMINLMYLVLTAMLALNVSSEILHAFKTINQSINQSNASIQSKNQELYDLFNENEKQPGREDRVKPYNDRAKIVRAQADELVQYLEEWKGKVITEAGGYTETGEIKAESNIDASTKLLVENNGGDEIKEKLEQLRELMINSVDEKDRDKTAASLPLRITEPERSDNNPQGKWSVGTFYNMPVMAAITLFSKMQNDVRNSEAQVVKQLFDESYSSTLKFDAIKAIALPQTSYALVGQKVEAQILLAAYNKTVAPNVTVQGGGGKISKVENGVAYWETNASGVGQQTVRGTVTIDMDGNKQTEPWEFQYMVGSAGGSLQLDKMNVFYIGVDNPVTVSAAGYSLEDVYLEMPEAEIKQDAERGKGTYNIRVTKPSGPQGVKVAIMAKTPSGAKEVGSLPVRIKYIPDPIAQVGGQAGGYMSAAKFRPQIGPAAVLLNFEFDARYIVVEFSYSVMKRRDPDIKGPYKVVNPRGAVFTSNQDIMRLQADLKPGDRVFIDDIKARGPDGRLRSLPSLSFTLN